VVTCALGDELTAVRARVEASGYPFALVVSGTRVVLGRLAGAALEQGQGMAEEAMEAGPSTVRPDIPVAAVLERLDKQKLDYALVTVPEGKLVGVVSRSEAESTQPRPRA
jgi:CBS domain-containing protein